MAAQAYFATDYAKARGKFLEACDHAGVAVESVDHPLPGPHGETLAIDHAWIGAPDAQRVLVTLSGTHGVEGFAGSGAQVGWLESGLYKTIPCGVAVLAVHAVNPYGFAWLRRVNEDNVDLNRNFVDHGRPYPRNSGFDQLVEALCPDDLAESTLAATNVALGRYGQMHGMLELRRAIVSGQYHHPRAVFFGGNARVWSNRAISAILSARLAGARHVALIDFHTGLGPYGYGEPLSRHDAGTPAFERLKAWYGSGVTASAFVTHGRISRAVAAAAPGAEFTGINLEFGTRPIDEVFHVLRCDNWLHVHGRAESSEGRRIKAQIRDAFYPDARDWVEQVWERSAEIQRQAVAGLCETGSTESATWRAPADSTQAAEG